MYYLWISRKTGLHWNANPEKSRTFHERLLLHIVKELISITLHTSSSWVVYVSIGLYSCSIFRVPLLLCVFLRLRQQSLRNCKTAIQTHRHTGLCRSSYLPSFLSFPFSASLPFPFCPLLSAPFSSPFILLHRSLFSARVPLLPCCFVPLSRPPDHISRAENMPPLGWSASGHPYSDPTWT